MSNLFARIALLTLASIALSGCFDLTQSVSLRSGGEGAYKVAISASGLMGEALKNGKTHIDMDDGPVRERTTAVHDGIATHTEIMPFRSLSDLALTSETMAVHVTGRGLLGLGATHAVFRRTFRVNDARRRFQDDNDTRDDDAGQAILGDIFSDHFYQFSVTLPGRVEWVAPVKVGDVTVHHVMSNGGHTVTWRMPLKDMVQAHNMRFSVGFSTSGSLRDAQTRPGHHHHRHHES